MARVNPFDPAELDKTALLRQLGIERDRPSFESDLPADRTDGTDPLGSEDLPVLGSTPGTSTTMPVVPDLTMERGTTADAPGRPTGAPLAPAGVATSAGAGPVAAVTPPPSGAPYTGFNPKYAMEGFNFGREQNPGKSAKDAFALLANQAPPPPLNDKAALGQWFAQYIQPGMDALGHTVSGVNGDTFTYGNPEGNFTVDYGRGAGAEGGALAWQAEPAGGTATPTRQSTSDRTTNMIAPTTGTPGPWTSGYVPYDDPVAQIQAEIDALTNGGASPLDSAALLKLLQGAQP